MSLAYSVAVCHQAIVGNVLSCYEKDSAKSLTVGISMAILMAIIAGEENL